MPRQPMQIAAFGKTQEEMYESRGRLTISHSTLTVVVVHRRHWGILGNTTTHMQERIFYLTSWSFWRWTSMHRSGLGDPLDRAKFPKYWIECERLLQDILTAAQIRMVRAGWSTQDVWVVPDPPKEPT
jgi:hypothetical protein